MSRMYHLQVLRTHRWLQVLRGFMSSFVTLGSSITVSYDEPIAPFAPDLCDGDQIFNMCWQLHAFSNVPTFHWEPQGAASAADTAAAFHHPLTVDDPTIQCPVQLAATGERRAAYSGMRWALNAQRNPGSNLMAGVMFFSSSECSLNRDTVPFPEPTAEESVSEYSLKWQAQFQGTGVRRVSNKLLRQPSSQHEKELLPRRRLAKTRGELARIS